MSESTININPQSADEALEKANQAVDPFDEALAALMGSYIKISVARARYEAEQEPFLSRLFGEGKPEIKKMSEVEKENRITALEQQISKQDKIIANHEADIQNIKIAIKRLNDTVNRWL